MVSFTFTLSEREYIDAQQRFQRSAAKNLLQRRLFVICMALANVYAVYRLGYGTREDFWFLVSMWTPVIVIYGTIKIIFSKAPLKKAFIKVSRTMSNVHVQIDEDGYRYDIPQECNGSHTWMAFDFCLESELNFILARGSLMYPLPKSAMTDVQADDLQLLLANHLPCGER